MNTEEIRERVKGIRWTHILDLGDGVVTPGLWPPSPLDMLGCPKDLGGMTVLDICAADGGYAFQAERLGADRVLATDSFLWDVSASGGTGKAAFDFARRAFNSKVESRYLEVLDHSPETVGVFDLVLFLGVLYHMRHPLLTLERVFSVTGKQAIVETHVDLLEYDEPAMAFYPGKELNGDPSNWWGPNVPAVEAMLRTVGFQRVQQVMLTTYKEMGADLPVFSYFEGARVDRSGKQGRAVFHAWR